jgi:hypothetical protein
MDLWQKGNRSLAEPRGYEFKVPVLNGAFLQPKNFSLLRYLVLQVSLRNKLLYVTQIYDNIQDKVLLVTRKGG